MVDHRTVAQPVEDRQVDVEADRQVEAKPLVAAAFRRKRDAELHRGAFVADLDLLAHPVDFAGRRRLAAVEPEREFAASGADQAVKTDDLAALTDSETSSKPGPERPRTSRIVSPIGNLFLVIDLFDRAVDHQRDQLGVVRLADIARADMGAVAQHRDAVGKLEDLFHAMADIDDRDAFALQPADEPEELRRFLAGQIGGRLVENQELRAAHRRARRRDQLLLADRQLAEQRGGRQVETEIVEHGLRHRLHLLLAHQAVLVDLVAEKQIGGDGQMRAEHDLLVHGIDAARNRLVRS